MVDRIALNLPLNSVSFGQISYVLIRSLYGLDRSLAIQPIGQIDASSQNFDSSIITRIKSDIEIFQDTHSRDRLIFKLWHLNGGAESWSKKQVLLSFYELDSPTKAELNCINNTYKVCFSSEYTVSLFKSLGCKNVFHLPLAFDKYNFYNTKKEYFKDRVVFNLVGKLEKRKHHLKILKAWAKKYGNNENYSLQCAIYNPFMKEEDQKRMIGEALENKRYYNISFLGFMKENALYNDFLNSANIVIGMSGGEGWALPEFHSIGLGKYGVIMNAHGYKTWANEENSVLVNPSKEKIEAYDGIHFHKNNKFNQGNIFDFDQDEFINGCEKAVSLYQKNKINTQGLLLQKQFSTENFLKNFLSLYN